MWFMLIYLQVPALQAALERIALRGSASPCQGRLEVYHQNQWGLVGFHEWHDKNGEVVCKSLGCGSHRTSGYAAYRYPPNQLMDFWMDYVRCSGEEESLWKCKFLGWNVTQGQINNFVMVECTGNIILNLNHNGKNNMCAGVVQFQGPNFTATVCNRDWDTTKADMVCKELQCGIHHKIPKAGTFLGDPASHYVPLGCDDSEEFSWQCVNWVSPKPNTCHEEANVICSNYVKFRLRGGTDVCNGTLEQYMSSRWDLVPYTADSYKRAEDICAKLMCGKSVSVKPHNDSKNIWLTCSDRIKVELVRDSQTSRCDGDVYVSINASRRAVCSEGMSEDELRSMGHVVCRELRCENLLVASTGNQGDRRSLSHVDCHGNEDSLWECLAKHNTGPSCKTVKVSCAGSVDVRLKDGLDRCSGRLEMQYETSWWSVTETPDWTSSTSDVVCGHLNCGKSFITEANLFVNGKLPALKWKLHCENSSTHISRCFTKDGQPELKKTVNIICTRGQIWFLQGNSSCEGRVKVEAAGKSRLLTEEDTWNNETAAKVCERLLCGSVRSFTPTSNGRGDSDSSDCSANSTSFSKCSNETVTGSISCSGSVEVRLDNKCWGKVLVCTGDRCGGVCGHTWKRSHSRTLCRSLGCGRVIGGYHGPVEPNISVGSIHCPGGMNSLSQCNFVLMSNASNCQNPAYIACAGSLKVALRDHRDECAGRAEVFFLGHWRPVCKSAVAKETHDALCASVGCGDSVNFSRDGSKALGLLRFTCQDGDISSCNFTRAELQECFLGHLTCTNWSRVFLTNPESACTGSVFELRGGVLHVLDKQGWTEQNLTRLCDTLQCGNGSHDPGSLVLPRQRGLSHSCRKTDKHIWDCAVSGDRRISTNLQHLNIRCKDEPSVSLVGNCTGELRIGQSEAVCTDSQNTMSVFKELCHQLGCSMYFTSWDSSTEGSPFRPAVPTRLFSCTGLENRLWQCSSRLANCNRVVSVACLDSIEFQLTEQCAGELQVRYRGYWQPVCAVKMVDADVVCEELRCGKALKSGVVAGSRTEIKMSFSCEGKKPPKHCLKISTSCREGPALIHCEKYVVKVPPNHGLTLGLSVGFSLILVSMAIVFWQRKRFLFILRLRCSDRDVEKSNGENSMDLPGRKPSVIEVDKYEDVEMMRLAEDTESRSQGEDEKDSSSGDSSGTDYDDVDEANIEPLLPACRGPSEPPLPPRPAHLLGDVDYKEELKENEDYDDVMSLPAGVSAKKCSFSLPRPLADPALVVPDNQTKQRGGDKSA